MLEELTVNCHKCSDQLELYLKVFKYQFYVWKKSTVVIRANQNDSAIVLLIVGRNTWEIYLRKDGFQRFQSKVHSLGLNVNQNVIVEICGGLNCPSLGR